MTDEIERYKKIEENLRNALNESMRKEKEVSALLEASRTILKYRDFNETARAIFDTCKNLIGAAAGYVALLSEDGAENRVLFLDSGGLPCTVDPSLPMPIRGLRAEAYHEIRTVYDNDFKKSEWQKYMPFGHASLDNVLFAPLVLDGKAVGLLGIANKQGGFDENDARMASAFAGLASIALYNSWTLESVEKNEERFRSVAQSASDAIISIDSHGNIVFWNQRAVTMFGLSPDDAIGKPITSIIPERYREAHKKGIGRVISTGESNIIGKTVELVGLRKDGSEFPLELSLSKWKTKEGIFFSGIVRDITDRKNAEDELKKHRSRLEELVKERTDELVKVNEELQQAQKMQAIGHLAGGIAHDFNNILTAIIGYGTLLKTQAGEDTALRHYAGQILSSSERAANLTRGLLAFGRKQIINPQPVNLNDIVSRIEKLLSRVIGEDIELKTALADKKLIIMADSGQIEQVVMNLCTNARDAMPNGGLLAIETGTFKADEDYAKRKLFEKTGDYAVLSVTDTGIGMDEKTRKMIFEPFFTTKDVGKGTGLGLSIVYGIIKQHDGYINVYSEPGKGTTFKIYFPLTESNIEESPVKAMPKPKGGTETIMVAEDNTEVRNFIKDALERVGYRIIEAVDGEDAIKVFNENRDKIHLLLLDTIMPKKNGREVYEKIKALNPGIKPLFMSGYTADIIHNKGMLETGLNFIPKPVMPNELLRKVREVLDK